MIVTQRRDLASALDYHKFAILTLQTDTSQSEILVTKVTFE